MRVALFPGTFDPLTNGHVDIATRAARLFDHVVLGVFDHQYGRKQVLFSVDERVELARASLAAIRNVTVGAYNGLTVDYARSIGAQVIVRGLRAVTDFEQEFPLAFMNRQLFSDVETIWLITALQYTFVSSSLLKEVAAFGANVEDLVPTPVAAALTRKLAPSPP